MINQALENVAFLRAQNGGVQSRLSFNLQSLAQQKTNMRAALGRMIDVDVAEDDGTLRRSFIRIANLTPLDPAKASRWQTSMEPIYERYLNARAKGLF